MQAAQRLSTVTAHLARSVMTDSALSHGPKELQNKGLVLLLAQTPNGNKPVYLLEELKALGKIPDYTFIPVSFGKNEQKSDWFEAVNPNGRIPALLDNREGKKPIKVWESASILLYLAKTYDTDATFHFKDEDLQTELLNWIFFIQGGVGPMQGQANHFFRYAPEKIEYGIKRYQDETRRLYQIYEDHLNGTKDGEKKEWLVGGKYTIADMCTQPWVRMAMWAGVELEKFPALAAWVERIEKRPATQAALKVPEQDMLSKIKDDPEYADQLAKKSSDWIMKGNQTKK